MTGIIMKSFMILPRGTCTAFIAGACLLLMSCAQHEVVDVRPSPAAQAVRSFSPPVRAAQKAAAEENAASMSHADIEPRFKRLSPLDLQKVSISFVDQDAPSVLQALAHAASLNLLIDRAARERLAAGGGFTAEFAERSVRDVLDAVCGAFNVAWFEKKGTIVVKGNVRKIFSLDFLAQKKNAELDVGGDVLAGQNGQSGDSGGSGGAGGSGGGFMQNPLSGSFSIKGNTSVGAQDIYEELERYLTDRLQKNATFMLSRTTGTLMVNGDPASIALVEEYVSALRKKYRRQVLIEMKILEVVLDDHHEFGIDWDHVRATISDNPVGEGTTATVISDVAGDSVLYGFRIVGGYYSFAAALRALKDYGSITALSNPRIKVMNGQPALLSVGKSMSYIRSVEYENTVGNGIQTTTPSVEIGTLFNGLLLGVTPVVEDDGYVNLHIVPIKSDILDLKEETVGERDANIKLSLPTVALREASTVLRARSGDLVVLGGLIDERNYDGSKGLPWLSELPGFLGWPFGYRSSKARKVELVILLKLQVIDHEPPV